MCNLKFWFLALRNLYIYYVVKSSEHPVLYLQTYISIYQSSYLYTYLYIWILLNDNTFDLKGFPYSSLNSLSSAFLPIFLTFTYFFYFCLFILPYQSFYLKIIFELSFLATFFRNYIVIFSYIKIFIVFRIII